MGFLPSATALAVPKVVLTVVMMLPLQANAAYRGSVVVPVTAIIIMAMIAELRSPSRFPASSTLVASQAARSYVGTGSNPEAVLCMAALRLKNCEILDPVTTFP